MNKSTMKTILNVFIGVVIFLFAVSLFINILPFLLIGGALIYFCIKVYGYFKMKKNKNNKQYTTETYTYSSNSKENIYNDDIVDTSEAIDVDYKEID